MIGLGLLVLRGVLRGEVGGEREDSGRPEERTESVLGYSRNAKVAITLPELTMTYCFPSTE